MFRPGQIIPQSAPYSVYHSGHRTVHEGNGVAGDVFPRCRVCLAEVRFMKLEPEIFFARVLLMDDPDLVPADSIAA